MQGNEGSRTKAGEKPASQKVFLETFSHSLVSQEPWSVKCLAEVHLLRGEAEAVL